MDAYLQAQVVVIFLKCIFNWSNVLKVQCTKDPESTLMQTTYTPSALNSKFRESNN